MRCSQHPAYGEDYCPRCGTATVIPNHASEPFRVCEDCGDDKNVALVHWDGKEVPLCGERREIHGLTAIGTA